MKIMMVIKNNKRKLVELRGVVRKMVVMKQKKIMSQLKKWANNVGNDEESGKENKGSGYGVDERSDGDTALVITVKNPVPMKIMMGVKNNQGKTVKLRGMIRRMVVMKKKKMMSQLKTLKQMVMEMMTNQGKIVELMGVVTMIVVIKKKKMMSWIKKMKQTEMMMMDAVMEIMAVMIKMTYKSAKEGGYKKKPRPSVNNLVQPEKNPTLLGFIRQLLKGFQSMILQKHKKTKTRKRKRTTVQYNESDVFTNCVKT
jgi:hypothetical protein